MSQGVKKRGSLISLALRALSFSKKKRKCGKRGTLLFSFSDFPFFWGVSPFLSKILRAPRTEKPLPFWRDFWSNWMVRVGHSSVYHRVLQGAPLRERQLYFTFPSAPDPLFKVSKAPFLTLRGRFRVRALGLLEKRTASARRMQNA